MFDFICTAKNATNPHCMIVVRNSYSWGHIRLRSVNRLSFVVWYRLFAKPCHFALLIFVVVDIGCWRKACRSLNSSINSLPPLHDCSFLLVDLELYSKLRHMQKGSNYRLRLLTCGAKPFFHNLLLTCGGKQWLLTVRTTTCPPIANAK